MIDDGYNFRMMVWRSRRSSSCFEQASFELEHHLLAQTSGAANRGVPFLTPGVPFRTPLSRFWVWTILAPRTCGHFLFWAYPLHEFQCSTSHSPFTFYLLLSVSLFRLE